MSTPIQYPESKVSKATAEVAGVSFDDPYNWLEADPDAVLQWQTQQSEVASSYMREWPHRAAVGELVEACSSDRYYTPPRFVAGSWFREEQPEGGGYPQVVVAPEPFGDGRVLAELKDYDTGDDAPFLTWLSPSPDGRVLAIGVCTDGSEHNTISLIDVASGERLSGAPTKLLFDSYAGGVTWLPDSSGFFFTGLIGSVHEFRQGVFLHRLGEPPATEPEAIPSLPDDHDYTMVQVSRDGRWAVAVHRLMNPIPVAVLDLADLSGRWRPFVTDIDGTVAGHALGGNYVAITDVDAPRGRLVSIPIDAPDPNDTACWTDLIPGSTAVLRTVTPVGSYLYVTEFEDTYCQVQVVDSSGNQMGRIPLPGKGAVAEEGFPLVALTPRGHPDEFIFGFSTLASSWAVYRHVPGVATIELLLPSEVTIDAVVEDHWAASADGTKVPYHTLRLASDSTEGARPTLIHAYGGFNWPLVPQYPGGMAAFAAAGGVFVHAHLRGGAEFGREWWEGGRRQAKDNCFADLYAVAEDLIARGVTTSDQLGVSGESNGGTLCGVALAQRPDLWGAVVPQYPLADLIGCCGDPYDLFCVDPEWATVEDPDEVRRLATFSPYHMVRDGVEYPAVYINAGANDPRTPPWHSRKLAARLQAAQAGDAPILLHVWENAGHGAATERSIALGQDTEWLAFTLRELGWTP
jgi:prolyl oligopeptidase